MGWAWAWHEIAQSGTRFADQVGVSDLHQPAGTGIDIRANGIGCSPKTEANQGPAINQKAEKGYWPAEIKTQSVDQFPSARGGVSAQEIRTLSKLDCRKMRASSGSLRRPNSLPGARMAWAGVSSSWTWDGRTTRAMGDRGLRLISTKQTETDRLELVGCPVPLLPPLPSLRRLSLELGPWKWGNPDEEELPDGLVSPLPSSPPHDGVIGWVC
ncbi:hypothetical protein B0T24DRAFT_232404 [Lasiosphaeria ovina]|uniref:Uncharacterized protein n=1 Tax=Lasiosphaeria ovina TaxID=92902 RepID=A0AAE0KHX8_9PEZI|nr:hypothetical protein B0T24DRAFT_232404 [Lasiosphaeria ovina]